jgi:hypothetical protein
MRNILKMDVHACWLACIPFTNYIMLVQPSRCMQPVGVRSRKLTHEELAKNNTTALTLNKCEIVIH